MPYYIICAEKDGQKKFALWSTVIDSLLVRFLPREEFITCIEPTVQLGFYRAGLEGALDAAARDGSDAAGRSLESVIDGNRAGDNETQLTVDELIEKYWYW